MKRLSDPLEPGGKGRGEAHGGRLLLLAVTAMGVVYGDIGTSPLYALRECFHGSHGVPTTGANVLGILSLVFWSLLLVVSLKYLLYVMRAHNQGEGGILALMALLHPARGEGRGTRRALVLLGLFGAALLYGDGTITPAISVLSAVEGLEVAAPHLEAFVVPITVAILVLLFLFQRHGTARVGSVFGPVMLLWFAALAVLGLRGILAEPHVLAALSPVHAVRFFAGTGWSGFAVLGAVFLVVTGGEALYADLGHFGARPIRAAWFVFVLPSLLLNYFGQGALLLSHPDFRRSPFYLLAPSWSVYPLVVLSTVATIIASQAVISGSFSLTRQAIQLGYLPRITVRHTSEEEIGQVYLPAVNWILMLLTIGLVVAFERSSNLASAYGIAVSTTMVITTILAYAVARQLWGWPRWAVLLLSSGFLLMDLGFFGANLLKVTGGGWYPIALAVLTFTVMTTWRAGRRHMASERRETRRPLEDFLAHDLPDLRVPGTAVFVTGSEGGTPSALQDQVAFNHVVHETVIVLTIEFASVPRIPAARRLDIERLPSGFHQVRARYGYLQGPHVSGLLRLLEEEGVDVKPSEALYFVGRETAIPTHGKSMSLWRAALFSFLARSAVRPSERFGLPHDRVIELGVEVEL